MKKALVALVLAAVAQTASAAIANSKHDMRLKISGAAATAAAADQQTCVYCHTPHNAQTIVGAPLWNRVLPGAAAYTLYAQSSLMGTLQPLGIASQTCLSCHDGTADLGTMFTGADRSTANLTVTGIYNVSRDLSNDHPVAVPYPTSGTDFVARATVNTNYRLYGAQLTVECGSCHEPHGLLSNSFFLRQSSIASAICTGCHIR